MPNDPKAPDPSVNSLFTAITPGYFDALGVKLLRGRDFNQAECENKDARRVTIIDEEMATKLFPNEDAVGQHIRYTQPPKDGAPNDLEIVGVVSKHRHSVDNETLTRRLFVPLAQGYNGQIYMHVRLNSLDRNAVVAFIPTLRQTLREIDPDLPLLQMTPYVDLMEKIAQPLDRKAGRDHVRGVWLYRVVARRRRCLRRQSLCGCLPDA